MRRWLATLVFLGVSSAALGAVAQGAEPPPPPPPPPPAGEPPPPPPPSTVAPAPAPAPPPGQAPPPGAYGQPGAPPPQGAPPPGYYGYPPQAAPPPPPPPAKEGVHEHDGFFLRFGIGYAYANVAVKVKEPDTGEEATLKGSGIGIGLAMIGGTVAPGFVLGGALLGHGFSEPDFEVTDAAGNKRDVDTADETLTFSVIGLFGQYYFDPTSGGYLQALIGFGQLDDGDDDDDSSEERPSGAVFGIGGGYDFWVGEQWSIGPELRLMYAPLKYERTVSLGGISATTKQDWNTTVVSLMFTATMH
ncbi:MAG: autotransporter domain-containing protein [Myxococcales bacterium]|nr:autotransporter domain-containing protein [Myxococcales bacterium]